MRRTGSTHDAAGSRSRRLQPFVLVFGILLVAGMALVGGNTLMVVALTAADGRAAAPNLSGELTRADGTAMAPHALPGPAGAAGDLVLRGGWLFDGLGDAVVRNPGILISGGRILAVGEEAAVRDTAGVSVIELGDEDYVLPGLIDLHAHYNVDLFGRRRRDEVVATPVLFLANGVTTTYPAGEYDPEDMFALRARIDSGEYPGPRIISSGPYYGTARPGWDRNATPDEIRADVDYWAARGVLSFKAKGISPEHLSPLIEQAHRHGRTVAAHLDSGFRNTVNPRDAILMGLDRVEHFMGGAAMPSTRSAYASLQELEFDTPGFREIAELFIRHHVYYTATITAYGYYGDRAEGFDFWVDEQAFLTPYVRAYQAENPRRRSSAQFHRIYHVKRAEIKAFYDAGGGHLIVLGTDNPSNGEYLPGFSVHRELDAFVLSGIPPAAALRFATINAARAIGAGDLLGSIEPGKLADLYVIRGNPLDQIRNTRNARLVIRSGEVFDPAALLASVRGKLGPANAEEARAW